MATKTASKSGLRAVAETKRTKAAQRTPLPGKDHKENVALAREAVAEAKPAKGTKAHQDAQIAEGMERKRARRAAEDAKPAKASKAEAEAKPTKASIYAKAFTELGWKSEIAQTDGLVELVATRGNETLYLAWMRESHVSGTSTYTISDRTVKVRNPAEAMRVAAQNPQQAKASQERVTANKQFRRRATGPTIRTIPFDIETATEEEIAAALTGHQITWHNIYRVESETATVGNAIAIKVSRHARGHRIVSFIDPETGFRAFRLEHLENVGRKVNLERIRQEILHSLTKNAKRADKAA